MDGRRQFVGSVCFIYPCYQTRCYHTAGLETLTRQWGEQPIYVVLTLFVNRSSWINDCSRGKRVRLVFVLFEKNCMLNALMNWFVKLQSTAPREDCYCSEFVMKSEQQSSRIRLYTRYHPLCTCRVELTWEIVLWRIVMFSSNHLSHLLLLVSLSSPTFLTMEISSLEITPKSLLEIAKVYLS